MIKQRFIMKLMGVDIIAQTNTDIGIEERQLKRASEELKEIISKEFRKPTEEEIRNELGL